MAVTHEGELGGGRMSMKKANKSCKIAIVSKAFSHLSSYQLDETADRQAHQTGRRLIWVSFRSAKANAAIDYAAERQTAGWPHPANRRSVVSAWNRRLGGLYGL